MELYDIAPAYYEAAQRITEKMQRLRAEFPDMSTNDAALSSLRTLRNELRDVGRLCEHYYEGGFWRDERYTFNSEYQRNARIFSSVVRGSRGNKRRKLGESQAEPARSDQGRIDTASADVLADALLRGVVLSRDRRKVRCK